MRIIFTASDIDELVKRFSLKELLDTRETSVGKHVLYSLGDSTFVALPCWTTNPYVLYGCILLFRYVLQHVHINVYCPWISLVHWVSIRFWGSGVLLMSAVGQLKSDTGNVKRITLILGFQRNSNILSVTTFNLFYINISRRPITLGLNNCEQSHSCGNYLTTPCKKTIHTSILSQTKVR